MSVSTDERVRGGGRHDQEGGRGRRERKRPIKRERRDGCRTEGTRQGGLKEKTEHDERR